MRSKAVALIVIALAGVIPFMTSAQSPEAQAPHERTITQKHFAHMPVAIKEVRNLNKEGDEWFRDLEIEVKNVSDKPIYFISIIIEFPDISAPSPQPRADGIVPLRSVTGFVLTYGNSKLIDLSQRASADDPALQPGDTYVFRIPEARSLGFANMKKRGIITDEATKNIELHLERVSFGDGTGYSYGRKRVYPQPSEKKLLRFFRPKNRYSKRCVGVGQLLS